MNDGSSGVAGHLFSCPEKRHQLWARTAKCTTLLGWRISLYTKCNTKYVTPNNHSLFLCVRTFYSYISFFPKAKLNTVGSKKLAADMKKLKCYVKEERCHFKKMSKQSLCTIIHHYTLSIMTHNESDFYYFHTLHWIILMFIDWLIVWISKQTTEK